jgi:ribosomal protein S18 acetylase RimI-like enzyme
MGITYFKRYRMEYDLGEALIETPPLPDRYRLLPWRENLVERHADAKYLSFREEIDANVFPCLGDRDGCLRLMRDISRRAGFVPEATWLLIDTSANKARNACGTIQGITDQLGNGSIQNLGIAPAHRSFGLGTILLAASLAGFKQAGVSRVTLEVTAQNQRALRLYERIGFRSIRTVYKAAEVAHV